MTSSPSWRTPLVVLIVGMVLGMLTSGIRHSFGLYLAPMTVDYGWGRSEFGFAIAVQSLLWGILAPMMGGLAERFGAGRVIFGGGLAYALGVYLISRADTWWLLSLSMGALVALGVSAAGFSVVLGAVGRAAEERRRSLYLGLVMAGGSAGMFLMVPLGQALITGFGWRQSLVLLAGLALLMPLLAPVLRGKPDTPIAAHEAAGPWQALSLARREPRYWLLFCGFSVCGFHVFFIATHLPAYLLDRGGDPALGAVALSLIGLFNIFGSLMAGYLGGRFSKRWGLAAIYFARTVAILLFIHLPFSPLSVLLFSSAIGFLWLSTVPYTSGLVGQMYGVRYLSTLFGVVFLGHQVGGFIGVWAGGLVYDATGSYQVVWYTAAALGVIAGLLHLPIDERSQQARLIRAEPAPATNLP